jgi:hypothetical protein
MEGWRQWRIGGGQTSRIENRHAGMDWNYSTPPKPTEIDLDFVPKAAIFDEREGVWMTCVICPAVGTTAGVLARFRLDNPTTVSLFGDLCFSRIAGVGVWHPACESPWRMCRSVKCQPTRS